MKRICSTLVLCLGLTSLLSAQEIGSGGAAGSTPASAFRADLLKQLDVVSRKVTGLAEATPEEKYSYRPAEGVRSTGEVFLHMTIGNFMMASWAGSPVPSDVDLGKLESSNPGKAKTVAVLKRSFDRLHQAVANTSDASLGKSVDFFGHKSTLQNALLAMSMHGSEHLGQLIAYARSSGVVPPWSQKKESSAKPAGPPKP